MLSNIHSALLVGWHDRILRGKLSERHFQFLLLHNQRLGVQTRQLLAAVEPKPETLFIQQNLMLASMLILEIAIQ